MLTVLNILILLSSLVLVALVLMHSGSGGGLTDMLGGGSSDLTRSSSTAERNLTRYTYGAAVIWVASVVAHQLAR